MIKRKLEKIELHYIAPEKLHAYENNPRNNDVVIKEMVDSIEEFGFPLPILITPDNNVVDGHLRLKAALQMNLEEVPVVIKAHWSEAQIKAFRLLANRSVTWATWDFDALSVEMDEIQKLNFDVKKTGFNEDEISALLKKLDVNSENNAEKENTRSEEKNQLLITFDTERDLSHWHDHFKEKGYPVKILG
jgi:ParB-like chromosome segregation protein Spo0J